MSSGLPEFLVVGAMKAGTTTLYRDLIRHPAVFMPAQKEPETLVRWRTTEDMRRDYAALFADAPAGAIKGEASTAYTKRPHHERAAAHARELCGPDLRIVYMRRDPIDRIVSHYLHERQYGRIEGDLDAAVRTHPDLIDFSRYAWQIAPWIAAFGDANVLQVDLEEFAADRGCVVARVLAHIGCDPLEMPDIDTKAIANKASDAKILKSGIGRRLLASSLYQRHLKGLMPPELRERARRLLLPAHADDRPVITEDTRAFILAALSAR